MSSLVPADWGLAGPLLWVQGWQQGQLTHIEAACAIGAAPLKLHTRAVCAHILATCHWEEGQPPLKLVTCPPACWQEV